MYASQAALLKYITRYLGAYGVVAQHSHIR